jgi:hypothetical protein
VSLGAALADARTAAYAHPAAYTETHDGIDIHVDSKDDNITMRGDDVVIKADDGSEAVVSPAGDLTIRSKSVAVDDYTRKLLRSYVLGIHDIRARGMEIGRSALTMVSGMLGTLVADLVTSGDDSDKQIDKDMRAKVEPLKQQARALCKDVQAERLVQAAIVAKLPAFQPYAVIDTQSEHDCHVDGNEV